jgi:hypothetical protein
MNQGIRLRWEKPTARGVRYYEVDLHRELWSEWLLIQALGAAGHPVGPGPGGSLRLPCRRSGADRGHRETAAPALLRRGCRYRSSY